MYFDWCSHSVAFLFAGEPTSTAQTYRSVTLASAYPKPKEVHYKINLKRSNATKSTSRNLCPSPMATSCCHRSSQGHARSGFLAPAFVIYIYIFILNFLLSKNRSVHFFTQIRIATFWIVSVCCYLQVCVHVEAARFGDVWNGCPGFAWVLLRCTWDIAKQNRNQMNIDAQQIQQQKHVPFELM